MNLAHDWLCSSRYWRNTVQGSLAWALEGVHLGSDVLEIGPGPGITTEALLSRVGWRLTCVEADGEMANALASRLAPRGVNVIHQDATAMTLPDGQFDSVVCFTMLHHVASKELQDRLVSHVHRVLRPGGTFAGIDSSYSLAFRLLHIRDTMVLVDPGTFPDRLRAAGFVDVSVDLAPTSFRFCARKALQP